MQNEKRHIFICGAKSIGQYGGYETFVDKLAAYQEGNDAVQLHILCKANGEGYMDETKLPGAVKRSDCEFTYHGAACVKLPVPNFGPATAIYYDVAAVRYSIRYCREHGIRKPVIYILTCRIGPFIGQLKRQLRGLDGVLHVNPDGHEWMRSKWSPAVRRYWKLSEKLMVKHADLLVCDSKNIEAYVKKEYAAFRPKTTFIAYGADLDASPLRDDDGRFLSWMDRHGLRRNGYYLVVGRFVPENNYETMLREFMRSKTQKDFVLITNMNDKLKAQLTERIHFEADPRIKFVGAVYDQPLLKKLRENAYAYFHGHEVGGTNPSLLEGLASTKVNLLLDVGFNREVGEDAALYWNKTEGSLSSLIDAADRMSEEERDSMGELAKARIREHYSWQYISGRYSEIWKL